MQLYFQKLKKNMTQPKRDKVHSNNKATRWDRIRKRHCCSVSTNLKSDIIKKFIEVDYIGRHQQNVLNGDIDSDKNLDPVLVMNLRHEMFKKIPRKLPLATVAYCKNLQQCRDHNVDVEDHYIENQLHQFRKHLQKQSERNKVSLKKSNSLLIDNTDIMKSLEATHQHIEDFYNTPIDALQEVDNLLTGKLKKYLKLTEDDNAQNQPGNSITQYINNLKENNENDSNGLICALNAQEDTNFEADNQENCLDFVAERMSELDLNDLQFQADKNERRTPSPLENTDELLQPLKKIIEDPTALHLKFVRFDDEIDVRHLKRETSICSNTSDGIDSVISDLAEEALKELRLEETKKTKKNLNLNGFSVGSGREINNKLLITGKVALDNIPPLLEQDDKISENSRDNYNPTSEQSKIIKVLFEHRAPNEISIMRKYFLKWLHCTTIEKIEREHVDGRADRVKKINIFLNKIRLEKKRLKNYQQTASELEKNKQKMNSMENVKINKKYQNKIKVQQDIIDLQRLKLERQERIIMELKLHKLSEEAREARQELKNELKSVIRSGDPKSRAKAKCLQIIGNLKDEEDENLCKLQGKSLLLPKFLQNMQERALERSIRHDQARQRRLQQEAEKEAQKLALEEAKRLEDEEAKRLRIEALKEKRRQEKMAKIIKERERQKFFDNLRKAQDFYKRLLLKRIGMEGFKRLLQRKRDNLKKCESLRQSLYKRTYFNAWFSLYSINKARRNQKADELHKKCLKRKYVHIWLQYVYEERCKYNIAVDYNELKIIEVMFRNWWSYTQRMQMIEETKMKQAISHHEWHLKWKALDCWQRLPQILQLEKETEERRQRWRLKIWELLPDYKPNRDDLSYM